MIQRVNDSKGQEMREGNNPRAFFFWPVIIIHLCTSIYINVTQYS